MLVLGIDTATDVCAVGLVRRRGRDLDRLAESRVYVPRSHAARLVVLIKDVLSHTGASASDLDGVAVSAGPGSYTGLRIGVSTAKGLCLAGDAALIAVSSLEALAVQGLDWVSQQSTRLLVAVPSRRSEVYAAVYERTGRAVSPLLPPAPVSLSDASEWLDKTTVDAVCGPGAEALLEELRLTDIPRLPVTPSGLTVALLGAQRLASGDTVDTASFEPSYLKAWTART